MGTDNKRELKEQYKNRVQIGGVYRVNCEGSTNTWLRATKNMQGTKNRFEFSVSANFCPEAAMTKDWNQFGASAFTFEVLEELKMGEAQTEKEFADDVNTLLEIWTEKIIGPRK